MKINNGIKLQKRARNWLFVLNLGWGILAFWRILIDLPMECWAKARFAVTQMILIEQPRLRTALAILIKMKYVLYTDN